MTTHGRDAAATGASFLKDFCCSHPIASEAMHVWEFAILWPRVKYLKTNNLFLHAGTKVERFDISRSDFDTPTVGRRPIIRRQT